MDINMFYNIKVKLYGIQVLRIWQNNRTFARTNYKLT